MKEQNFEIEKKMETLEKKYIPNGELYSPVREDFGEFLKKSSSGNMPNVFSIPCRDKFFAGVSSYTNPLRKFATCIKTKYESIEVPVLGISYGMDGEDEQNAEAKTVEIRMYRQYASTVLSSSMAEKIKSESHSSLIKAHLASKIAKLEREMFISCDKDGRKGIVKEIEDKIEEINIPQVGDLAQALLNLKFKLAIEFRQNGAFLMSSDMLHKLTSLKDADGRFIYDGDTKIFGRPVIVMDEVPQNYVLFGDFKQAYIIADMEESKLEFRPVKPGLIEVSLPLNTAGAVILPEAIVGAKFIFDQEEEEAVEA